MNKGKWLGKYSHPMERPGINFCVVYFSFQKTCSDSEAIDITKLDGGFSNSHHQDCSMFSRESL